MPDTKVPLRKLGKNGPLVPALGLGLMGMSMLYGLPPSDEERFAVLDRAVEIGATNWDTSDLYGDCEELLGKWFTRTGKRDQIFLASKFGLVKGSPTFEVDSSAAYCKKACAESLRVLGIDHIDLYYMHRANPNTPIEETVRAMAELKAEGKIKYIGLSEVSSTTLRRACKVAHIDAVQVEYSAFVTHIEESRGTNLLATARELGVAVVAYSPLGRGILTGAYTKNTISAEGDKRAEWYPMYSETNFEKNLKLVEKLKSIADKKNCTLAQLAIAWLLKQGDNIIPIPGTKKIRYLEENWGSLHVQLTDEEEAEIRKLIKDTGVAGGRYPEFAGDGTLADTREE
ncbi:aldo/keto reductase, putative [Talaromyces stipitatus ATCC 10500]|uniref:Aldo/keto reductase, putative n=1 Tax=Talaromyces stipitatus (strain ATCC 10500 / CBS 375.48 / QM 6759 / NRRL 1006) TaxID=441959 RepID=B8MLU0_TALSN|nr:aldo/keto reductase, putative [Talaromyces stipitatus ATCC 10500]EED13807.1 aldo/keto reductase, putative [Talaromyces stipitatus ATCC 10500]